MNVFTVKGVIYLVYYIAEYILVIILPFIIVVGSSSICILRMLYVCMYSIIITNSIYFRSNISTILYIVYFLEVTILKHAGP